MAIINSITHDINIAVCETVKKHLEHEDPPLCPLCTTSVLHQQESWLDISEGEHDAVDVLPPPPPLTSAAFTLLHQWLFILVLGLRFYRAVTVTHLFGTLSSERSPACDNLPDK